MRHLVVNRCTKLNFFFLSQLEGLLVHFGQSRDARHQDYFTLMLKNGTLVLSFSLGGPRGGQSHALSLTLCCVKIGSWHQIKAGRSGRDGYLELDSQQTMGNAPPGTYCRGIYFAKKDKNAQGGKYSAQAKFR